MISDRSGCLSGSKLGVNLRHVWVRTGMQKESQPRWACRSRHSKVPTPEGSMTTDTLKLKWPGNGFWTPIDGALKAGKKDFEWPRKAKMEKPLCINFFLLLSPFVTFVSTKF